MPAQHNPPLEDIRQALTGSLARSGAGGMLGPLNMSNNPITGVSGMSGGVIMGSGDFRKATNNKVMTTDRSWADAQSVSLGSLTGTVRLDFSTFLGLAHGTVTGNIFLEEVSNAKQGQTVVFDISQDATGGRTVTYDPTYWLSPGGTIAWNADPNARNVLVATVLRDGKVMVVSATLAGGLS